MMIGTDLKRSASNVKRAVSANNHFLLVKRLSVVHDSQNLNIGTDLKRSASNLKPTVPAATVFLL